MGRLSAVEQIRVSLLGSLGFTGKGQATDRAVVLGLCDQKPDTVAPDSADIVIETVKSLK
jgi:L-serine dehydratase